jgi:hypothetical protein
VGVPYFIVAFAWFTGQYLNYNLSNKRKIMIYYQSHLALQPFRAVWNFLYTVTILSIVFILILPSTAWAQIGSFVRYSRSYAIAGTGQSSCYSETGDKIDCKDLQGEQFNSHRANNHPLYRDNGDETVSDISTGLMWTKSPSNPIRFSALAAYAANNRTGGYSDWRIPTIKELYSLIIFSGGYTGYPSTSRPYIDESSFEFHYGSGTGLGKAEAKKRPIDVQEWSSTKYIGRTMGKDESVFGVNFADGRIKAYPIMDPANQMQTPNQLSVRLVRGPAYGINAFKPRPHTIIDEATGLEWQRKDDGRIKSWREAHSYCKNIQIDGHFDWLLPTAKELHSIVDYQRIPAINPLFELSDSRAYLWSSTTHLETPPPKRREQKAAFQNTGELAIYAAIGPALGRVEFPPHSGNFKWLDAHGAGAMRSDPKTANPNQFPDGFGPQGDDIRGYNYVLCVRTWAN